MRLSEIRVQHLTSHQLTFEISQRNSQVRIDGYGGCTRRIEASVMLRCVNKSMGVLAARRFHASLLREVTGGGEEIVIEQEDVQVVWDEHYVLDKTAEDGLIVDKPFTPYRYFHFYLEITPEEAEALSHEYFLRVAMFAVGQDEPFSLSFSVNNWNDARQSNSAITLRD